MSFCPKIKHTYKQQAEWRIRWAKEYLMKNWMGEEAFREYQMRPFLNIVIPKFELYERGILPQMSIMESVGVQPSQEEISDTFKLRFKYVNSTFIQKLKRKLKKNYRFTHNLCLGILFVNI